MIQLHEQTADSLQARGGSGIVERDGATEGKIAGGHKNPSFFGVFEHHIGRVKEAFEPIQVVGFVEGEASSYLTPMQGDIERGGSALLGQRFPTVATAQQSDAVGRTAWTPASTGSWWQDVAR